MIFLHAWLPIPWNYYAFSPESDETSIRLLDAVLEPSFRPWKSYSKWELRQNILVFCEAHPQGPPRSELKMNYSPLGTFLRLYLCQNHWSACQVCPIRHDIHSGGRCGVSGFCGGESVPLSPANCTVKALGQEPIMTPTLGPLRWDVKAWGYLTFLT